VWNKFKLLLLNKCFHAEWSPLRRPETEITHVRTQDDTTTELDGNKEGNLVWQQRNTKLTATDGFPKWGYTAKNSYTTL
jgi:hypothetical protein